MASDGRLTHTRRRGRNIARDCIWRRPAAKQNVNDGPGAAPRGECPPQRRWGPSERCAQIPHTLGIASLCCISHRSPSLSRMLRLARTPAATLALATRCRPPGPRSLAAAPSGRPRTPWTARPSASARGWRKQSQKAARVPCERRTTVEEKGSLPAWLVRCREDEVINLLRELAKRRSGYGCGASTWCAGQEDPVRRCAPGVDALVRALQHRPYTPQGRFIERVRSALRDAPQRLRQRPSESVRCWHRQTSPGLHTPASIFSYGPTRAKGKRERSKRT